MHEYPSPRLATSHSYRLAEGPVWDPIRNRVLWVDILSGTVTTAKLGWGNFLEVQETVSFPDFAGAVTISPAGEMLVAGRSRLYTRTADGAVHAGRELLPSEGERRLNDGKPDPAGRFLVGTLSLEGSSEIETLVRVESDGTLTTIDDDLTLSNGLAWTADGSRMYNVDSSACRIYVRDYDAATGETGDRTIFVELTAGFPDGICIDIENHLWVAVWGAGEVHRYSPTGDLVGRVRVSATHVSAVAFAGDELDTLVITTATEGLSDRQHNEYPLSGRLFTLIPGVRGPNPPLWAGTAVPAPSPSR